MGILKYLQYSYNDVVHSLKSRKEWGLSNVIKYIVSATPLFHLNDVILRNLANLLPIDYVIIYIPYGIKIRILLTDIVRLVSSLGDSKRDICRDKEYFLLDKYKPSKGFIIVDVGASIGVYSLIASKLIGKEGYLIAIEPEPATFSYLLTHLKLNNVENVRPFRTALSDTEGRPRLFTTIHADSYLRHSLIPQHLTAQGIELRPPSVRNVRSTTLDSLVNRLKLNRIDLLKIDVEGAEDRVLRGSVKTLEKNLVLRIIVEVHKSVNDPNKIMTFLSNYGFETDKYYDMSELKGIIYASSSLER